MHASRNSDSMCFLIVQLYSWQGLFEKEKGSFREFSRSYETYGLFINKEGNLEYREWAPNAKALSIVRHTLA